MEVLQLDDPLEAGLQVAILFEHPLILGADGLLDSDDLAADFVVEFGGVGISRPVGEHGLRPAVPLRCPDDGHDLDPAAAIPKRLPEFAVRGTPGAERRRGLVAGLDVDEDGALGVQRDGQLGGKPGSVFASPDGTTTWQHLARYVYHRVCTKVVNRVTRWVYGNRS